MHLLETHIAEEQKEPIRIQEYAVGIFTTTTTRSAVKKAIKKNLILVDNIPTTTSLWVSFLITYLGLCFKTVASSSYGLFHHFFVQRIFSRRHCS